MSHVRPGRTVKTRTASRRMSVQLYLQLLRRYKASNIFFLFSFMGHLYFFLSVAPKPEPAPVPTPVTKSVPCRYGAGCAKIYSGCPYSHPPSAYKNSINATANSHFNQHCRFGAACTRASCPFQHPAGRVLPSTFHRGLSTQTPIVSVPTPEAGSMGATNSPHKTVIFNKPAPAAAATTANANGAAAAADKENAENGSVVSGTKTVQAKA